jgi:hypothetical protein
MPSSSGEALVADKKPKSVGRLIDRISEAIALVNTIDYALGGIEEECQSLQAARDLRMSAYLAVKRLRKIEKQMYALAKAELEPLLPEVPHD